MTFGWAYNYVTPGSTTEAVLQSLERRNHIDDYRENPWVSTTWIAEDTGIVSRGPVYSALRRLEAKSVVERHPGSGSSPSFWRFNPEKVR